MSERPEYLFKPGQSGNPGGRPKRPNEVVQLARSFTTDAIITLGSICKDPKAPPAPRVAAAVALLERGWGKPIQPTDVTSNGESIRFVVLGVQESETTSEWTTTYAPPRTPIAQQ